MSHNATQFSFIELEALVIRHKNLFEIKHSVNEEQCFCFMNYRATITLTFKVNIRWTKVDVCSDDPNNALNRASAELLPLVERYIVLHSEPMVVEATEVMLDKV